MRGRSARTDRQCPCLRRFSVLCIIPPSCFKTIMKNKHFLLGLAAGAALLVGTGCSKQESPATPAADNATPRSTPAASEKQPAVETPKAAESRPAAPAEAEPAATAEPAAATPAPATASAAASPAQPATSVAVPSQKPGEEQPAAQTATASVSNAAATQISALQSAFQAQKLSVAQTATNEVQALAVAATNRVSSALAITNQAGATATNQVQVLLERVKILSSNQKYQEALATVNQLYETKLTPEQKLQVDTLKSQIQTALAQKATSEAGSVLGNILGGKKQ